MYAVIVIINGTRSALVRTSSRRRAHTVATLCALHLHELYPGADAFLTDDQRHVFGVWMHPDKDGIIDKLRALEWPLPTDHCVLEGEYSVL